MYDRIENLRHSIQFEKSDRNKSIVIGIGFLAVCGMGVWTIATGDAFGIVPALAGGGLAIAELHDASEASDSLKDFRAQLLQKVG